jgi:hypothetical protein
MAQFSIEINDADVFRVLNAVAANYGRPDHVENPNYNNPDMPDEPPTIENPETKAQFANRKVREFLAENVRAYEIRLAKQLAEQSVNSDITIIDPQG